MKTNFAIFGPSPQSFFNQIFFVEVFFILKNCKYGAKEFLENVLFQKHASKKIGSPQVSV